MPALRTIATIHLGVFSVIVSNFILFLATGWRLESWLQVLFHIAFLITFILLIVHVRRVIAKLKSFAGKFYLVPLVLFAFLQLVSLAFVSLMLLVSVIIQRPDVRASGVGHEIRAESRVFWPKAYALYKTHLSFANISAMHVLIPKTSSLAAILSW